MEGGCLPYGEQWKSLSRCARLAQSVERQALNLVVGGSSPPVGDLLFFCGMRFLSLLCSIVLYLFCVCYWRVVCDDVFSLHCERSLPCFCGWEFVFVRVY